jgi:RES domain-containing protein
MTNVWDDRKDRGDGSRLCARCVGEPFLKALIRREGPVGLCSYCNASRGPGLPIGRFADLVEQAFTNHFVQTSLDPDSEEEIAIRYGDLDFERHGLAAAEAIAAAASIEDEPAEEVRDILAERNYDLRLAQMGEESPFDEDSHYEAVVEQDDQAFQDDWERFERGLKSEARFFSRSAAATLASVFNGVCDLTTRSGMSVVRAVGPGEALSGLYRARVLQSMDRLEEALMRPDVQVGPPASHLARAGRMNARGVPVFYGATDPAIALAEVRPPVGSDVVVAKFEVTRKLRVLDVGALGEVFVAGSVFDPTLADRARRARFLQRLSARIVAPVMPDNEEFDYLVTQAMADYLADQPDIALDGIYFPSAQRKGKGSNVVLFHKASRLQPMNLPEGTEVTAYLAGGHGDDDERPSWRVYETTPNAADADAASKGHDAIFMGLSVEAWFDEDGDPREPALRLDPASVVVRHVDGVTFRTTETRVSRERREAPTGGDRPFF